MYGRGCSRNVSIRVCVCATEMRRRSSMQFSVGSDYNWSRFAHSCVGWLSGPIGERAGDDSCMERTRFLRLTIRIFDLAIIFERHRLASALGQVHLGTVYWPSSGTELRNWRRIRPVIGLRWIPLSQLRDRDLFINASRIFSLFR